MVGEDVAGHGSTRGLIGEGRGQRWPRSARCRGHGRAREEGPREGGEAERTREGRREQVGGVVYILASGEVQRSSYPLVERRRRGGWTATGAHGPAWSVEQEATGEGEWAGWAGLLGQGPAGVTGEVSFFLLRLFCFLISFSKQNILIKYKTCN